MTNNKEVRSEAAGLVRAAIEAWGQSEATAVESNATQLEVVLRSPYSSRTFVATVWITEAREV